MASPAGGTETPIDRSLVDRIAGAVGSVVGSAIRGVSDAWFGPGQPTPVVAPPDVKGRAFDYPVGANLTWKPRGEQGQGGIDFATLRALADPTRGGLDLLRLAIQTRKDQMAAQRWSITPRLDEGEEPTDAQRKRAREIKQSLRRPDGEHTFRVWQRMLLEDLLVLDAPVVYLAPGTRGHKVPQIVDGATIKRLVRGDGRTPTPPDPAYRQALKGLPAVDYSSDEMIYGAFNQRPDRVYGMSPVEQVVMIVDIALRRQVSQLEYYTAGSVPDVIFGAPESWSADQIRSFQAYWDALLSGNTSERRRARFVPGDIKPFVLKPDQLKDEFDEWLARVICFCFSLSPQALVKELNRATAETQKEMAQEEGLEPLKLSWADFMDEVLEKAFPDGAGYCYAYDDEEIGDAKTKADVHGIAVGKWLTRDEVRAAYGKPPLTPEQRAELAAAQQPVGAPVDTGTDGAGVDQAPPKSEPAPAGTPPIDGAEVVQDTALNGAQVASLLEIVQAVTAKEIPAESARGIIGAAFPMLRTEQLEQILGSLDAFDREEPKQEVQAPPASAEPAPEPDDDEQTAKIARALVAQMRSARIFIPARIKRGATQLGLFPPPQNSEG